MLDQTKRQNSKELDTTHMFHECTDAKSPCVIVVAGHFQLSYALENFYGLLIRKSDMINIGLNDLHRVEDRIRALSETRRQKVLDVGQNFIEALTILRQPLEPISDQKLDVLGGALLDFGRGVEKVFTHDADRGSNIFELLVVCDAN